MTPDHKLSSARGRLPAGKVAKSTVTGPQIAPEAAKAGAAAVAAITGTVQAAARISVRRLTAPAGAPAPESVLLIL